MAAIRRNENRMTDTRNLAQEAQEARGLTQGELKIVRPSELAKAGITGTVAEGILEKVEPNKFNEANKDYFIRDADGTLYIVNGTAALNEQLGQPGVVGLKVTVQYNGQKPGKKGRKGYHDFTCMAAKV